MKDKILRLLKNFKFQIFITFLLVCIICYFFPYSGDDWAWGTSVGIERLESWFADYNGRYVGNLFVLLLTRSELIKTTLMSLVIVMLCYNIYIFINREKKEIFWLALVFIFLTPTLVFAQTVAWVSGFTNYVIPSLFIFLYLNLFKGIFSEDYVPQNKYIIYALILGFSNSLIMENISLFNVFISVVLFVYTYIKHKKIDFVQLSFFGASLLGVVYMFSNGAYHMIASNEDTYRSVVQEGNKFVAIFNLYFNKFYKLFFMDNQIISIYISLLAVFVGRKLLSLYDRYFVKVLVKFLMSYSILYGLYIVIKVINPGWQIIKENTYLFEGSIVIGWVLSLLIITLLSLKNSTVMKKTFILEMTFVVLLVPLFFVNPIWHRNVFPLYVILFSIGLCLYDFAADFIYLNPKYVKVLLCGVYIYTLSIYGIVYRANERRINNIEKNRYNEVIKIKKLPYSSYLWMSEPKGDMWVERFKLFYNIPEETKIKIVK